MSMTAAVITHRRKPEDTRPALRTLFEVAHKRGVTLRFSPEEAGKHQVTPGDGIEVGSYQDCPIDICFALGGDGTILAALRTFAGRSVPVFAVNFGAVGFLSTVERDQARAGFEQALAGEYEVMPLPGIEVVGLERSGLALNDVSIQRKPGERVAHLAYSVGDAEIGRVRCDGLVIATPAGSTGYNLANGGPVMAWGVEGYAISFIAPHSLTARALVVAPSDPLIVHNVSTEEEVDVALDGRPVISLEPGGQLAARFVPDRSQLAQLAGTNFYGRLREKFGRLATLP